MPSLFVLPDVSDAVIVGFGDAFTILVGCGLISAKGPVPPLLV